MLKNTKTSVCEALASLITMISSANRLTLDKRWQRCYATYVVKR